MYKQKKLRKLGKTKSHRDALIKNQLRSLFENGKVQTTTQKAKALKANAESLINKGKTAKNDLKLRRDLQITFGNKELVKKFMEYVKNEDAGVSIVKVAFRSGDNAEVSRVELLGLKTKAKKEVKKEVKEEKVEKTVEESKENKVDISKKSESKSIDKTATVKNTARAKSRSGL
jgi:large subunit ribosomal protein L17